MLAKREAKARNRPARRAWRADSEDMDMTEGKSAAKDLPTPEQLRELLDYDPSTGEFVWKPRAGNSAFNSQWSGKKALADKGRYFYGTVMFRRVLSHRVAWAITYGEWPVGEVDHINGNPHDNRICNLRLTDRLGNSRNMRRPSTNRSGVTGVYWSKNDQKWRANICVSGRTKSLGQFNDFEDAVDARKRAERHYGFHKNHGRPALAKLREADQ